MNQFNKSAINESKQKKNEMNFLNEIIRKNILNYKTKP